MKMRRGLTFIEVLIAVVITGAVLAGILLCFNSASRYARNNANQAMALFFAQGLMEEIANVDYANLDAYNAYTDTKYIYQNVSVETTRNVEVTNFYIDTFTYKLIKVTASWNWLGNNYTEELNTLRSNR